MSQVLWSEMSGPKTCNVCLIKYHRNISNKWSFANVQELLDFWSKYTHTKAVVEMLCNGALQLSPVMECN